MTEVISVVIPVYNSQESLPELSFRLIKVLNSHDFDFELIFVDDGSRDDSWQVIKELAGSEQKITGIKLSANFGQHNALFAGLKHANGTTIVTLDDDLQNPPEEIPALLTELFHGFDLVYGTPTVRQHNTWRNIASRITLVSLMTVMGIRTPWRVSSFRAFKATLVDSFRDRGRPRMSIDVLLSWATSNISTCVVAHDKRQVGQSNYSIFRLLTTAIDLICGFSVLPLRIVALLGITFSFAGMSSLIYVSVRFMVEGSPVQGFPFLAIIISIFSGVQLFAVGVLGEYLGRIYEDSLGRPPYIVAESTSNGSRD